MNINNTGFFGRQSYKIRFTDIAETFIASCLGCKILDSKSNQQCQIEFSLLDLFSNYSSLQHLEQSINKIERTTSDRPDEMLADFLTFHFSLEISNKQKEIALIDFYNTNIKRSLDYLVRGDSCGTLPCIEKYEIQPSKNHLENYIVTLNPAAFFRAQAQNVFELLSINDNFYNKFKNSIGDMMPAVTWSKQVSFALEHLNERFKLTGEKTFDLNIKEIKFRHLIETIEDGDKTYSMPTPSSLTVMQRLLIPVFLETNGTIDIINIKVTTHPNNIEDIDIVFSITKPAINNKYLATAFGLSSDTRSSMSETQIEIYEGLYTQLERKYCFGARPQIEESFIRFLPWLLKKISFCLEEPSYLKDKVSKWISDNKEKKYKQIEDDFFLPFLYEKLKDSFGNRISRKSENFGGEVDLSFDGLPIELKVRKYSPSEIEDKIVNDKFQPASQASVYASNTRLGFVLILDLPADDVKNPTNLNNCFYLIEKQFDNSSLPTSIIVCIFYCNLPKPSVA